MRYAYGVTALLLLSGSAFALSTGNPGPAAAAIQGPVTIAQSGLAPRGAPNSFADLAAQLQPAVVNIATKQKIQVATSFNPLTGERAPITQQQQSGGSGFFISADGLIVTNNHVVAGGPRGEAVDEVTVTLFDGREFKAKILGRDATSDLALLKVEVSGVPYVEMESSQKNRVGDWVIAIGNPLGLGSTVTAGIVSALQRNIGAGGAYDRFIQTDTAINPGNSGGPLFNLQGKVIGINNRLISPVGANIGVGFAIPAEEAMPVIESLRKGVRPERGYLGIGIEPMDAKTADALGLQKNLGERVTRVQPGEPADKAGLKEGDIVLKVNGQDVTPDNTLSYIVANIKPGARIPLEILRESKPVQLIATVGTRPTEEQLAASQFDPSDEKQLGNEDEKTSAIIRKTLGINVISINPAIARQLGVDVTTKGLVVDVAGTGNAAQAGLRRGDIIVSVNYKQISSNSELERTIVDAQKAGRSAIFVGILRGSNRPTYVTIDID